MRDAIARLLSLKTEEYEREAVRVATLLKECAQTKQSPPKDYWHKLDKLKNQCRALRELWELEK